MENLPERITLDSSVCNGKTTIRNKRNTVGLLLDLLSE